MSGGAVAVAGGLPAAPTPASGAARRRTPRRVLPGFGLSLGFTVAYLWLIVLIPLAALFLKTARSASTEFWAS